METTKAEGKKVSMDGFCWWVVRVMAEALIAKLLDWLLEKLKERLSPKNDGKHFKGDE